MTEDVWKNRTVYVKGFWGWLPERWASVGFTRESYRDTLIRKTTDPFIMVAYITTTSKIAEKAMRGRIVGFYLVSHQKGHRDHFTHPDRHGLNPEKWQHALKATRAFTFRPEARLDVYEFDPVIYRTAQATASWGRRLVQEQVERLKALPRDEVPIFDPSTNIARIPPRG